MAKKRPPSMNIELLEYMKFLHLHNLVDIISIIESIPIYYQTQIKKYGGADFEHHHKDFEYIKLQKLRLHNLTYIAQKLFKFHFPSFSIDYQTWRNGPYSLDLDNECNNLIYSDVFNNAISSKKTFGKRYNIIEYDKKYVVDLFNHNINNYRKFLELVDGKDVKSLRDISFVAYFHGIYINGHAPPQLHRFYVRSFANKYKLLRYSLKGLVSNKKDYENYILYLIDLYFKMKAKTRTR
jgi:hypothetical protein